MADLFDITHEVGDLSEYTSSTTDSGDLSVVGGSLMQGANCLSFLIDDTNLLQARKDVTKQTTFRTRFYLDPNALSMAASAEINIHKIIQTAGSFSTITNLYLRFISGNYNLRFRHLNDANAAAIDDNVNISDGIHYVEYQIVQAASDVSSDGTVEWWVDDVSQGSATGIDNFNRMSDQNWRTHLQADNFSGAISGTFYMDSYKANNDGGVIGAVSSGISIPVFMNQYRQRTT